MDISFEMNGRKIQPNQLASEMEKVIVSALCDDIRGRLQDLTGEGLTIEIVGKNFDDLTFELKGPPDIIEQAKRRL